MADRGRNLYQMLYLTTSGSTNNLTIPGSYTIATLKTAIAGLTTSYLFDTAGGAVSLEGGGFLKLSDGANPGNDGKKLKKVELEAKIKAFQTTTENTMYTTILGWNGDIMHAYWIDDKIGVVSKGVNLKIKVTEVDDFLVITGEVIGAASSIFSKCNLALA